MPKAGGRTLLFGWNENVCQCRNTCFYPAVFKKDKREILVEGEVFLEVEKDPSRPFIVKTNRFEVKVLGTQFNVCAYKEDAFTSVVLVNGSVEVNSGKNNRSVLSPNQMIKVNDKGTDIKEVDVLNISVGRII